MLRFNQGFRFEFSESPFRNWANRKVLMENFIGGLFQTRERAYQAYQGLQAAGFDDEDLMILSRKRSGFYAFREGVSIKSVAISALIGAVIGTGIAALLGFLIGQGVIDIPAFIPLSDPFFALNAFGLFLAQGAVTGAILGVVARLATGKEKPTFTHSGITHGGVILAVNVEEHQVDNAREVMKQAGALDLVNLSEKWNPDVWSEFRELQPPTAVS
jgi:hypothetical protein